ncbi:MAG: response regulator [Chloroflexota bacterium]
MDTSDTITQPDDNSDEAYFLTSDDNAALIFESSTASLESQPAVDSWKVLIVDDESEIHTMTRVVLQDFLYENRPLNLISAYSGAEAKQIIKDNPDIALILLDVVMEENDTGLQVVRYIRNELSNQLVRIILRTGQPGETPQQEIFVNYYINDYKTKLELTHEKLMVTLIAALRSYQDVLTIQQNVETLTEQSQQLEQEIQERKQAEAQLQTLLSEKETLLAEIEQRVEQRTEQLAQATAVAETANRAKSDFLASMSHELRTPLNGILGYTQILKRDDTVTPGQYKQLDVIEQSGHHLLTLINEVLDLAKIEARRIELEPADLNLPVFFSSLIEMFRPQAEEKGLTLNYKQAADLPRGVSVDSRRLRQIVINLLGNAIKFTDEGAVTLQVTAVQPGQPSEQNGHSSPGAEQDVTLRFEVIDSGTGIAQEQQARIFLPFEQVGNDDHRRGIGLGLAISSKLVEAMGGQLQVDSTLNQGSRFWFEVILPQCELDYQDQPWTQEIIGYNGPQKTLLVADDTALNRAVLYNLLKPLGFIVVEALNGDDCIKQTQQLRPDAILLDIMMPDINGVAVTQQLRGHVDLQDLVIIATSASVFEKDRRAALEAGCNAFLPKPIDAQKLFMLLESQLDLTWLYRSAPDTDESPSEIIAPPPEVLAALLALAHQGNITGLRKQVAQLKNQGDLFTPFVEHLNQLIAGFEDEKIANFIEHYISARER